MDQLDLGQRIKSINVPDFSRGQTHRFQLHVTDDGMGKPVSIPLMVAKGRHDGPTLGITAALHGNEINGIPVIHRLFEKLDASRLRGTVVAALVVNVPGFVAQRRRFPDSTDLNTIMPGNDSGNAPNTYAARVADGLLPGLDALIDLHTASRGRINSLYARADMQAEKSAQFARLLRPQIVVHKEAHDGTLRGEAANRDIPAVTLEIGNPQRFQPEFIRKSVTGIRAVMSELGMIAKRPFQEKSPPIICSSSFWVYTDHGGLLSVAPDLRERLDVNTPLAVVTNIFGDVVQRIAVTENNVVVIGKSVNPVGYAGARVAHLGRIISPSVDGHDAVGPNSQRL